MNITAYCLIIRSRDSVQPTDQRCSQNYLSVTSSLFPKDDIKIYDASKSTASRQSCLYQYLSVDLQGFFVGRQFVKEFAAFKD